MSSNTHIEDTTQFPYTGIADIAGKSPTLQERLVPPVDVVEFHGAKNPRGIVDGSQSVLLQADAQPAHIVLDFGKELVGHLDITASANRAGSITVTYAEFLEELMSVDAPETDWYYSPKDIHALSNDVQTFHHEGRRAFRFVKIKVDEPGLQVNLKQVRATCVGYPVTDRGSFSCSDPLLDEIWTICRYTTQLCMQDFYEDGIKRDGLLWVSDYRVQFLCNWTPFGDSALARRSLIMMAASQRADGAIPACAALGGGHQHPGNISYMPGIPHDGVNRWILIHYASDYLSCLLDYVNHTGDTLLLDELKATIGRLVGFLVTYNYDYDPRRNDRVTEFDDWKSQGTVLLQVLLGVTDGMKLSQLLRDDILFESCLNLAKKLRRRVTEEHYDQFRALYTDQPAGHPDASASLHVNSFAILAGIASGPDAPQMLLRAREAGGRQGAWGGMRMWQHAGEFEAGLASVALSGMRDYWGFEIAHGATTAWEQNDQIPDGSYLKPIGSRCHGWSAGACHLLPRYVLGIAPTEPGFAAITIDPQIGDLDWAQGVIPTPHGDICVELESGKGGKITLPNGMRADIRHRPDGLPVEVVVKD